MIKSLKIYGLRGFANEQAIEFAVAEGEAKLGLTIVVGANSSGKSTIVEAIRALAQDQPPSFSQGRRNVAAGDRVELKIVMDDDSSSTLRSVRAGASESEFVDRTAIRLRNQILVLPSRRVFNPYFGKHVSDRSDYMQQMGFPPARSSQVDQFTYRLFQIERNRGGFDELLKEVVGSTLEWSIDQSDQGQYFLKVSSENGGTHSSEGMGEGLVSLMYIVDALYDSQPGQTIVIDEPELSLHPQYQKSLLKLLKRYAADRQIIISTHSPYFVDVASLSSGMRIHRVVSGALGSNIHSLGADTAERVGRFVRNDNNPHIVGLNAREALFSGDRVVLFEGQEDIVFLDRVLDDLGIRLDAAPFGWGVGGADNMSVVARMLSELGFEKVVGILDSDKAAVRDELAALFQNYHFACIPAPDIRTKKAAQAREKKDGLLDDENRHVRAEHKDASIELFTDANEYLNR